MSARFDFYVVWKGRKPGIYSNWEDCKKQIHKFSGAKHKGFNDFQSALEAFNQDPHY